MLTISFFKAHVHTHGIKKLLHMPVYKEIFTLFSYSLRQSIKRTLFSFKHCFKQY